MVLWVPVMAGGGGLALPSQLADWRMRNRLILTNLSAPCLILLAALLSAEAGGAGLRVLPRQ